MQVCLRSTRTLAAILASAVFAGSAAGQERLRAASPDGRNAVVVETRDGGLYYSVQRDGRAVLLPSRLGFEFRGLPPLRDGLHVADS
ncbi:MAG: glycoside hydrolase family 97 N-terminal domain-containing protein, partial [Longimicrobiales bacterium]